MQHVNFIIIILSAFIPMIIGAIWYSPKVLGTIWMKESGVTQEQINSGGMLKIFGFSILFSLFLSMSLQFMVIHQFHLNSIIMSEVDYTNPGSDSQTWLTETMANYGNNYRTFKHGLFHGILVGLFFAFPLIGINSLFERRSFKYIFIHSAYWIISFGLMGGVICAFT
ncbi:MAG: DUF1761 domain-containing protein [Bacteroidia bacterium]